MADKTKAQLEAENEELNEKVDELTNRLAEERPDTTHFESEIRRINSKLEKEQAEHDALKVKVRDEKLERETLENDRIERERQERAQFGTSVEQDEHTRFRVLPKAPSGQRDIFGDPVSEVVDLGVEFNNFNGGIYVPVSVFIEVGQSIGMLTKEQATDLNSELTTTKAKVEFAGTYAKELSSGIENLVNRFFDNLDSIVGGDSSDSANGESAESSNDENAGQTSDPNVGSESNGVPAGSDNSESDNGNSESSGGFFSSLK